MWGSGPLHGCTLSQGATVKAARLMKGLTCPDAISPLPEFPHAAFTPGDNTGFIATSLIRSTSCGQFKERAGQINYGSSSPEKGTRKEAALWQVTWRMDGQVRCWTASDVRAFAKAHKTSEGTQEVGTSRL